MVMKTVHRYAVPVLAAFLILGGVGAAARDLVTAAGVQDRTLESADFRDGSLRRAVFDRRKLPRGPRGHRGPTGPVGPPAPSSPSGPPPDIPLAHASVAADGTVQPGSTGVAVKRALPGVYCVSVPDARWVQASVADPGAGQVVSASLILNESARPPCDADATIRVSVAGPSGEFEDGPFHLLARNG